MSQRQLEVGAATLSGLTAVNAIGGAIYGLGGAPKVPLEWLEGSPFSDYRVPALFLGLAVGGSAAVATVTASRGSPAAGTALTVAGGVLSAWILAQVQIIGLRSPLQPIMGAVGVSLIGLGRRLC